jgi:hypothetical protein
MAVVNMGFNKSKAKKIPANQAALLASGWGCKGYRLWVGRGFVVIVANNAAWPLTFSQRVLGDGSCRRMAKCSALRRASDFRQGLIFASSLFIQRLIISYRPA